MKRKKRVRKLLKAYKQAEGQGDFVPECNHQVTRQYHKLLEEERARKKQENIGQTDFETDEWGLPNGVRGEGYWR